MRSLPDLQRGFSQAVFDGGTARNFLATCTDNAVRAGRGLAAYRNSILANLAGAVIATYPVIARIVGREFLAAAARRYALERPSTSGDLNAYGHDFDEFLAAYEPARQLPYLPAVAGLEWRVQQVEAAADAPTSDFSLLAATPPDAWGGLRFHLDPAHALLPSRWPLARLWEVNQPAYAGDFAVDFDVPQTVLIHRRDNSIAVEEITPAEDALLTALSAGGELGTSVEAACSHATDFNLQAALQRFIACGLLRNAY